MNDKRKPVIVCTGMCDTKGNEIQFLAEQVEAFGGEAVIVDVSLGSASPAWAHIRNDEVDRQPIDLGAEPPSQTVHDPLCMRRASSLLIASTKT